MPVLAALPPGQLSFGMVALVVPVVLAFVCTLGVRKYADLIRFEFASATSAAISLGLSIGVVAAVEMALLNLIAAGGIADAAGVAAAMALGASAVQVGTAYLLCPEATTSAIHRQALASEDARHTALTHLFTGRPARGIVNRLMRELGPLHAAAPAFPLATAAIAPLRAAAEAAGSSDFTPLWSGQNASGCRDLPAANITREFLQAWASA